MKKDPQTLRHCPGQLVALLHPASHPASHNITNLSCTHLLVHTYPYYDLHPYSYIQLHTLSLTSLCTELKIHEARNVTVVFNFQYLLAECDKYYDKYYQCLVADIIITTAYSLSAINRSSCLVFLLGRFA